jgi:hypothetical protein
MLSCSAFCVRAWNGIEQVKTTGQVSRFDCLPTEHGVKARGATALENRILFHSGLPPASRSIVRPRPPVHGAPRHGSRSLSIGGPRPRATTSRASPPRVALAYVARVKASRATPQVEGRKIQAKTTHERNRTAAQAI